MSVIRTDLWLENFYHDPLEICSKLLPFFQEADDENEIYSYLIMFGMYRYPLSDGKRLIQRLQESNVWDYIEQEKNELQKQWDGPDIPVFILPADSNNLKLKRDQNGKSGLAFKDKLFLFISDYNDEKEIRAMFTHEYHHVCRLSGYPKSEDDYVLLDTIILEGLAEHAVLERFGSKYVGKWTKYYFNHQLEKMWKDVVMPYRNISKNHPDHENLLYGRKFYPKMLGYCVGYYLVNKYTESNRLNSKDVFNLDSRKIAML